MKFPPPRRLWRPYHLLASTDDPVATAAMEETVTVLVPVQNPDGRDRFVHHFEMAEAL